MRAGSAARALLLLCVAAVAWLAPAAPAPAAHVVHSPEGSFDGSTMPEGPFRFILGVAADSSADGGDVYVAEVRFGEEGFISSVFGFDENGAYTGVGFTGADTPHGSFSFLSTGESSIALGAVAVDSSGGANDGDIYVADAGHRVVDRFNDKGEFLCEITGLPSASADECAGPAGSATPDGGFVPEALAIGAGGDLYVADSEHKLVDRFGADGQYLGQISGPQITEPRSIDVDSSGALYLVNGFLEGGTSLVEFDSSGAFVRELDSPQPAGLAVDRATGNVYVSHSFSADTIDEYDAGGNLLESFAVGGGTETAYIALAVDSGSGRIYGANFNAGSIDSYSPDTVVPDVIAAPASAVEETTARLDGTVDPDGGGEVSACRFEYGHTAAYGQSVPCAPGPPYAAATAVGADLSGLDPSTTYHFRLAATSGGVSPYTRGVFGYSPDDVLVTTGPPTVEEESAQGIEHTAAELRAKVNPHGFDTEYRFEFVDAADFANGGYANPATRSTPLSELGSGLKSLSVGQEIAGLAGETTYHYRVVASNSRGTVLGPDKTFDTLPVAVIARQWAYAHVRSATLEAEIDPVGQATTCRAEYVDDAAFQQSGYASATALPCPAPVSGTGTTTVKVPLPGLAIDTTYHFHFVAENANGTLVGKDESFSTFGIETFSMEPVDEEGHPYTQAGGHPYAMITTYRFKHTFVASGGGGTAGSLDGFIHNLITEQPSGNTGTGAPPKCPGFVALAQLCTPASQVGNVTVEYLDGGISTTDKGLFDVTSPDGISSRYAILDPYTVSDSHVRAAGDFGTTSITPGISEEAKIVGLRVEIWGDPVEHQGQCQPEECEPPPHMALLRNPTQCGGPQPARARVDAWEMPGEYASATTTLPAITGCDKLEFHPSIEWRPTSHAADSPTGLHVDIHQPQNTDPKQLDSADLRNAVISPAKGLILNPAGAKGLVGCTPAEIGLGEETPSHCPDGSKVGSLEIVTPLTDHPLRGGIYIAKPHDNPFDALFAIYLAANDPQTGAAVKLAGEIRTDPGDGQITAAFADNPQLPVEDFKLDFFGGPRAVLRTPSECGTYLTESTLTPWSAPQSGPPAHPTDSYEITEGPNGAPCASSEAAAPNRPEFQAGTTRPVAGAYAPFVMKLHREDGTQRIASLEVTPPAGLLGRLAGLPRCADAAVEAARGLDGEEEQARPSCPAGSRVGTIVVGAGAGADPYYTDGKAYLAGPYRGAPLSLAAIVPAVAGPFDLGNVVVRIPLRIDLESGQIEVDSDRLPTILRGVALDVRTIAVNMDRPGFTVNPTSCEPMTSDGTITSLAGQSLSLGDPFQLGGCAGLGFKPKIDLRLLGKTSRRAHPALRAVLRMPKAGANIARIAVAMPSSEFLDNEHIRGICTRRQFAEQACPPGSIYGHSVARTPLLDAPLAGPVYMRSSNHRLPDLVAELNGEFRLALGGRIGSSHGGVTANVGNLPDAPLSKFTMTMLGGGRGLLQNSVDVCREPQRATIELEAQNGKVAVLHPPLRADCGAK